MFEVVLASALIVTEGEQAAAMEHAAQANKLHAAQVCLVNAATDLAEHTNETAKEVSWFAVRMCAKEIQLATNNISAANALSESLERRFALQVVKWRAEASKKGSEVYGHIRSQTDPFRD